MTTKFKTGDVLYTKGLDNKCTPVICKVTFVGYLPEEECKDFVSPHTGKRIINDCVVKVEEGFKMVSSVVDYHLTPEAVDLTK